MKLVFSKLKNDDKIKVSLGVSPEMLLGFIKLETIKFILIYRLKDYAIPEELNSYKEKVEIKIQKYLLELNSEHLKSDYLFKVLALHKELFLN